MKYVRFMGKEELKKYINGETLNNKTIWKYRNTALKSTAKRQCGL